MIFKAILVEFLCIKDVTTIDNQRTLHSFLNHTPSWQAELLPLGKQQQGISIQYYIVHVATISYRFADTTLTLFHSDWVVNTYVTTSLKQLGNHHEGS